MFKGLGSVINAFLILFVLFVPLGVWKFIDIIIWAVNHIHFEVK